uniref:Mitogen-activated protein kinase kinase kinase YODA isoform X1 n=1 Tax=Rhizophora mucronata TaxID=61149 RepID=A0A2P2J502_RHIMU
MILFHSVACSNV